MTKKSPLTAAAAICGLLFSQLAPLRGEQAPATAPKTPAAPKAASGPKATPAAKAAPAAAAAPAPADAGWPRDYTTKAGGALRVFQPQVASWDAQRRMVAYAA